MKNFELNVSQNGYLWVFPVPDDSLNIAVGSQALETYEFGKKLMSHQVN
jgi:hypothetical protein